MLKALQRITLFDLIVIVVCFVLVVLTTLNQPARGQEKKDRLRVEDLEDDELILLTEKLITRLDTAHVNTEILGAQASLLVAKKHLGSQHQIKKAMVDAYAKVLKMVDEGLAIEGVSVPLPKELRSICKGLRDFPTAPVAIGEWNSRGLWLIADRLEGKEFPQKPSALEARLMKTATGKDGKAGVRAMIAESLIIVATAEKAIAADFETFQNETAITEKRLETLNQRLGELNKRYDALQKRLNAIRSKNAGK